MYGRKAGMFAALMVALTLLGGCGTAGNNLRGTMDGNRMMTENKGNNKDTVRNGMDNTSGYGTGTYSSGGTAYWDGYGINNGREMFAGNNAQRNTYGMRTDGVGDTLAKVTDDLTGGGMRTDRAVN